MGCVSSKVAAPENEPGAPPPISGVVRSAPMTAGAVPANGAPAGGPVSAPQRYEVQDEAKLSLEKTDSSDDEKNLAPAAVDADKQQRQRGSTLDFLDKKIDKEIARYMQNRKLTALFLGTGECGKSTVFKQMRLCYGNGFTEFEREQYSKIIWADALRAIRMLADMCYEELKSDDCEPALHRLVLQWLQGSKYGSTALNDKNVIPDFSNMGGSVFGPVTKELLGNFMWLCPRLDEEDIAFERDYGGLTVESRAIRNAIRLLQSIDMSREAFVQREKDEMARKFLQGHTANGRTRVVRRHEVRRVTDPNELMKNTLEGIVDDGSVVHSSHAKGAHGLAEAYRSNGDVSEYEERMMRPKRKIAEVGTPSRILLAAATHLLWESCPDLIKMMVASNQLGLETNAKYFLDNVGRFVPEDYLASDEDILRGRIKTVGLTSFEFDLRGSTLVVTDAGGQKIERPRWLHNFDDTSCVLYVANAAAYDQILDDKTHLTRLDEALNVFETLSRSHWFRAKSFQLILNKIDILEEKCKKSSFRRIYPNYKGDDRDPEQILDFIENMFQKRFQPRAQGLYVYRTCATDTRMMQFVVSAVSDMILQENLRWAGMF